MLDDGPHPVGQRSGLAGRDHDPAATRPGQFGDGLSRIPASNQFCKIGGYSVHAPVAQERQFLPAKTGPYLGKHFRIGRGQVVSVEHPAGGQMQPGKDRVVGQTPRMAGVEQGEQLED